MYDQNRILQFRTDFSQVLAHHIAILRVIDHDEKYRFLAQLLVVRVALAPFLDAQLQIVGVLFGNDGALMFCQLCPAGGIRKHWVLDNILCDGLDEWIVAHRLHKNGPIVVPRRSGDVYLDGEFQVLLQQPVVYVLDALEPRQAVVVNVVRLVVEHGQFVNFTNDFTKVNIAVGRPANRLGAKRRQEEVTQVVVLERRLRHVAQVDAMNIGKEQVAGGADYAYIVLNMQCELEVVTPVAPLVTVVRQHRIVEEDAQPVEICAQSVQHDDIGRDQQKVARQSRLKLV